ncbi:hypothetical protein SAMN05444413_12316 [Roseivivax marinus]|uniref:outer membrane protein assembly factor BamE n=1 Tax=Roseivivax marinus TaxID=1379903 RepID=UPI0008D6C8B8|nr:outer membrane protein assembly factor BamE [Roseivivax marinus]SEL93194.1 hypothetical protein SAMN05444413_12316 [Roseivivax marinus]
MTQASRQNRPLPTTFAALATSLTLAAGALSVAAEVPAVDRLNAVDPGLDFTRADRAYVSMDQQYSRVGTELSLDQVRQVAVGQTRAELLTVLGRPIGQHQNGAWEFQLALPFLQDDQLICQYMVFFDGDDLLERAVWRRPQCADLVTGGVN